MSAQLNVASLLGELTLEEKASLCLGSDFWHTAPIPHLGIDHATVDHLLGRLPQQ
jgi:beta-glucosidase